jgi:hypothetical protein
MFRPDSRLHRFLTTFFVFALVFGPFVTTAQAVSSRSVPDERERANDLASNEAVRNDTASLSLGDLSVSGRSPAPDPSPDVSSGTAGSPRATNTTISAAWWR